MSGQIPKNESDTDKYCRVFFIAFQTFQEDWSVSGVYHLLGTVEVD